MVKEYLIEDKKWLEKYIEYEPKSTENETLLIHLIEVLVKAFSFEI